MIQGLTGVLDFQAEALVLRAERQRLIASNIANADTPGYKARDFDFASALRNATAGQSGAPGGSTNALGGPVAQDLLAGPGSRVEPALRYARAAQTNLDSNSVDMDRERASFADNSLKYESTLRFINASVRTLNDAMKSPNQS